MASPSVEQRIKLELSRRGSCSFLDLKSALKLPKGHISPITDRLAHRGLVKIEKDHLDSHLSYTWIGPKEEAKPPDATRPKKAKGQNRETSRPASPRINFRTTTQDVTDEVKTDWRTPFATVISRTFPSKLQAAALDILNHPDTQKVYRILLQGNKEKQIKFGHVLYRCAEIREYIEPTMANLHVKPKLARLAADAAKILHQLLKESKHCPGVVQNKDDSRFCTVIGAQRPQEIEALSPLSDAEVLDALQIAAAYCDICTRPIPTRSPDMRTHALLLEMDRLLSPKERSSRCDPTFEAIGHLVRTTLRGCEGSWSLVTTKKTIEKLRRDYEFKDI